MKKLLLVFVLIMLFTFSAGCAVNSNTNTYNINAYCLDNEQLLGANKVISIQSSSGFNTNFADYSVLVKTYAQFKALLASRELQNPPDAFNKQAKTYTSKYFEDNYLIIIADWQPSGSIKLTVDKITIQGNTVNVQVSSRTPNIGTDDMRLWIFLIEIDANQHLENITYQVTEGIKIIK